MEMFKYNQLPVDVKPTAKFSVAKIQDAFCILYKNQMKKDKSLLTIDEKIRYNCISGQIQKIISAKNFAKYILSLDEKDLEIVLDSNLISFNAQGKVYSYMLREWF